MIQNYDLSIPDTENIFCFSRNLQYLFELWGIRYDEAEIFVASDIAGFFCNPVLPSGSEFLHGRTGNFERSLYSFFEVISYDLKCFNGCGNDMLHHIKASGFDTAVIVWLDDFYLQYNKSHYQSFHFHRIGLLTEGKEAEGDISFYDLGHHRTGVDNFLQLTKSPEFLGNDFSHRWYEVSKPSKSIEIIHDEKFISDCLTCFYTEMNLTNMNKGINGMKQFFDMVKRISLEWNISCENIELRNLSKRLHILINAPGGPKITRYFFYYYLSHFHEGNHKFEEIAGLFGACAKGWETLGNMFFRLSNNSDSKVLPRIVSKTESLIESEFKLLELIKQVL